MSADIIITTEKLGKKYRVAHQGNRARYATLREVVCEKAKALVSNPRQLIRGSESVEEFWALKDVSLDVKQGEVVGVIGRNGAGKSTLLKILSRITEPTEGCVRIGGRVASLLEVGTGFHQELTGRENIFLNGAILGMTRAEIRKKFDEIVAFAEVEKFLDTPVKWYSSGMYVRLAFAVAAHLEPEILIVDEVLAVGDAQFQKKCLGKIRSVSKQDGRTVLFVSHNMPAIRNLCSTGIYLSHGNMRSHGDVACCIDEYVKSGSSIAASHWYLDMVPSGKPLMFVGVEALLTGRQPHHVLELSLELQSSGLHKPAFFDVDVLDETDTAIMQAVPTLERFIRPRLGRQRFKVIIDLPPLVPGRYSLSLWVGSHNTETLDHRQRCVSFEILESPTEGRTFPHTPDHGSIVPFCHLVKTTLESAVSSKTPGNSASVYEAKRCPESPDLGAI